MIRKIKKIMGKRNYDLRAEIKVEELATMFCENTKGNGTVHGTSWDQGCDGKFGTGINS